MNWIYALAPNLEQLWPELLESIQQTAIMVSISGVIAWFLGIATGVVLVTTNRCSPKSTLGSWKRVQPWAIPPLKSSKTCTYAKVSPGLPV